MDEQCEEYAKVVRARGIGIDVCKRMVAMVKRMLFRMVPNIAQLCSCLADRAKCSCPLRKWNAFYQHDLSHRLSQPPSAEDVEYLQSHDHEILGLSFLYTYHAPELHLPRTIAHRDIARWSAITVCIELQALGLAQ